MKTWTNSLREILQVEQAKAEVKGIDKYSYMSENSDTHLYVTYCH